MPRVRSSSFETPTARLSHAPRWVPYPGPTLAKGIKLLYRRNKTGPGTWVVRVANGSTAAKGSPYWTKAFAVANDYDKADGVDVLDYGQAQDRAKQLARGDNAPGKPTTVDEALTAYEDDLKQRGADPMNAKRVHHHMTTALAGKLVAQLTVEDLRTWRKTLIDKALAPATVNRTRVGLRAALEFAAASDQRIANRNVFRLGLKALPNANKARRVVLPDCDVLRIVAESYREHERYGLLTEVLAQTGARMSQAVRINCGDLKRGDRLMVPTSYKGGKGSKKIECVSVPITAALAAKLALARKGRGDDEPLLLNLKGARWRAGNGYKIRRVFSRWVKRAGIDRPDVANITPYALRHSSICRGLLNGVPQTIVAQNHDTSVKEIEAHYAKFIHQFADEVARRGLLLAPADKVVVDLPLAA